MQPIPAHFKSDSQRSPLQCDYILRNWFSSVAQNIFYGAALLALRMSKAIIIYISPTMPFRNVSERDEQNEH